MTPVVLVCDEGPGAGLGHRRRCEAIATALRAAGVAAAVVPSSRGVVAAPVLVVDSYRFRADDRRHFVPDVVVAIDDLERDLDVDAVVVPAPGGATSYVETARRAVLAGADYALVGPEVTARGIVAVRDTVERVLVTTGATDTHGTGAAIAAAIVAARPDLEVRLVVGAWGHSSVPAGVTPVVAPAGLTDELAGADLVVTAGGVTLLEALALGRPCVAVATADNQLPNLDAAAAAGAAVVSLPGTAAERVASLCSHPDLRRRLHEAGPRLIDGAGAARVAAAVLALVPETLACSA